MFQSIGLQLGVIFGQGGQQSAEIASQWGIFNACRNASENGPFPETPWTSRIELPPVREHDSHLARTTLALFITAFYNGVFYNVLVEVKLALARASKFVRQGYAVT